MLGWSSQMEGAACNFSDPVCACACAHMCVKSINKKLGAVHTAVVPATQVADEGGSSIPGLWSNLGNIDSS